MKKRILALLMASVMLFASACSISDGSTPAKSEKSSTSDTEQEVETAIETAAAQKGEGEKIVVGCTVYYMSEFVTLMCKGIESGAEKYNLELKLLDADRDPAKQMSQVEGLIAEKVDVLLVAPVHSASSVPVLELANNAGIPIVILNTELDTQDDYYFVGPNDIQAGELMMEYLAERMGGKGNIVILEGPIGHSAQIQRREGIGNVLKKYPDIKILAEKTANWNRDEAVTTIENWVQAYAEEGIHAVVAENDEMALGAVQALESKGIKDKVLVGGVDAIKDACIRISEGRMDCTILQDAVKEGELGIEIANMLANGEKPTEYKNLIQMELITKDDQSAQKLLDTIFAE